jgi:ubiquinone biosynthesis protein Coq4
MPMQSTAFDAAERQSFVAAAASGRSLAAIEAAAAALKAQAFSADRGARLSLAADFAHAAFAAPEKIAPIYDAAAAGWIGRPLNAAPIATTAPIGPIPAALWDDFWPLAEDAANGRVDAISITARTAALGGLMPADFVARVAAGAHQFPAVSAAANGPLPSRICLDDLARQPAGSLGAAFHALIVDNKFDLEVLDRDALGLSALPKPLDYLNTRILQAHDLWHIVAGYDTTALHEIALSGFQMAQFGHNYSAMFLAVTATSLALAPPEGFGVVMDVILTAYAHGRETPPLIAIPWEQEWSLSAEAIRARYGVTPYQSPYPANLIEMSLAA